MFKLSNFLSTLSLIKDFKIKLAFFWSFFLTCGMVFGAVNSMNTLSLYLSAASCPVYLFSFAVFRYLFLGVIFLFAHYGFEKGLILLISVRGLFYGFLFGSINAGFGSAGWLICLLFNTSNALCAMVDLLFCFSVFENTRKSNIFLVSFTFVIVFAAIILDKIFLSVLLSIIIPYY